MWFCARCVQVNAEAEAARGEARVQERDAFWQAQLTERAMAATQLEQKIKQASRPDERHTQTRGVV